MYDVLIVGGGPAGLYAAYCLAKAGRSVALFEEHAEVGRPVHCTGLVPTESFSRFDLPREAVRATLRSARFHSPGGRVFTVASEQDETMVVDRSSFDQGLADQARAAGVDLFMGHRVEALRRLRGSLVARTSNLNEGGQLVRGRLAILAAGAAYGLHRGLGLAVPGRFVHGAQVEVDFAETSEVEIYFGNDVAPGSFAWVVPFPRNGATRAKIGLLSSRTAGSYLTRFLQSPMVAPRLLSDALWTYQCRPVPVRPLARTFADRLLVVGDAAGLAKPTTGGGVYYGLLSAELAAGTACAALSAGDCSARVLSRYQTAWRAALASEIRAAGLFRGYASQLSDGQIDEAFDLVSSERVGALIRNYATFNWHKGIIHALWQSGNVRRFLCRSLLARGARALRPKLSSSTAAAAPDLSGESAVMP